MAEPPKVAPRPANIERSGLLILIRGTLTALDHANKTGNYSTFRDLAAPSFMLPNNPARLAEIFSKLRQDKVDLSGVLINEPTVTLQEYVGPMLHLVGFFPSGIGQLNFEMLYEPVNGQWRLFGISAATAASGPVPPAPPVTPAQPQAPRQPQAR